VFSTGTDFADMIGQDLQSVRLLFATCTNLMNTMQAIPSRWSRGSRARDGCRLPAGRDGDLAVASQEATFCTPGARAACSAHADGGVGRSIGRKRALEMAMSGDPIDAQTALSWGW